MIKKNKLTSSDVLKRYYLDLSRITKFKGEKKDTHEIPFNSVLSHMKEIQLCMTAIPYMVKIQKCILHIFQEKLSLIVNNHHKNLFRLLTYKQLQIWVHCQLYYVM